MQRQLPLPCQYKLNNKLFYMKKIIIIALLVLATASCKKTTYGLPSPSPRQLILGSWTLKNFETKQFKKDILIKDTIINAVNKSSLDFMSNDSVRTTPSIGVPTTSNYGLTDNQVLLIGDAQFYIITLNAKQLSYLFSATFSNDTTAQAIFTYTKN